MPPRAPFKPSIRRTTAIADKSRQDTRSGEIIAAPNARRRSYIRRVNCGRGAFKTLMQFNFARRKHLVVRGSDVQVSWRKCHKKAKNARARLDSNLPSCRNAYKQISELSVGGISVHTQAGFRRTVPRG